MKVELHCHLDGSLNPASVQEMLQEQGIYYEIKELKQKLEVEPGCRSLTEYLEKFALPLRCLQTSAGLRRAAYEIVRDAWKEDVKYMEVRFAPMLHRDRGLSCKEIIENVTEGLAEAGKEYGVYASAIVCAMRHHSLEMNLEMFHCAKEFLGNGVCALDLAGDESAFPTKMFRELFVEANKYHMPFTIHSGECGSVENVREAIFLGAKRLGHGIALAKNEELQEICRERRIGIEMCPTSNLQTKAIENMDNYPLEQFIQKGIAVSVNTDNRTVSGTTLTREFELVRKRLKQSEEVIKKCTANAVETAFASDEIKHKLYQMMK